MLKRTIFVCLLLLVLTAFTQFQTVQLIPPSPAIQSTSPPPTVQPTPTPQPTKPAPLIYYNLNSVWGSSGNDVFAVGEMGTILHYDGNLWSPMNSSTYSFLTTVWGSSGSDVFVVGWNGTMLHYDGSAWSPMDGGTRNRLWGVWGSSGDDVFAFGDGGVILHYDGKAWSPMDSGTKNTLATGWGSSGSDVFAVGWGGTILHYDGSAWSPMDSGTSSDLWGVWGSSGQDVFVAGEKPGGTILHYDSKSWSPMDSGTSRGIWGVWAGSDHDVFIVGELGTILHYDGNVWSSMDSGTDVQELTTVWGGSSSDVFAVGYYGTILHYDGTAWSDMSSGASTATPAPEAPTATVTPTPTPQPTTTSQAAKPTPKPAIQLIQEKITSQALAGNLLGDPAERTVYVLLPPGYATSDQPYPVVYVLPWGGGEPTANTFGFMGAMRSLLRKGEINEMIVVVPDGTNKLGASHFGNSSTIGDYETYVTQDVVDYIDTHYRTLPTRDSRGLAGCSNGGDASMRLGFKYPNVFSVIATTDGEFDCSLEVWPSDVEEVHRLTKLPQSISDLDPLGMTGWYVQTAAGVAPDPDNPPFYCEMPFRIVNGRGEFVPEVIAKIVENDAAHEARRYVQQPVRLRGIRIQHGSYDTDYEKSVHSFEQLLTDLGIEHEYVEEKTGHCGFGWEAASLKYMSDRLAFTPAAGSPPLTPTMEQLIAGAVFRGNLERTGVYDTAGPEQGTLKWKFAAKFGDWPTSAAVADGVAYFQSVDEYLHAVDVQTGQEIWQAKTGLPSGPPTVVGGVVYVGSQDRHLYALDAQTGQEIWKFNAGGWVESSPAVSDRVVYVGADDHYLYAVDSQTGQEKWRFETGDQIWSSPAIADGVLYVASQDSYLYAVDTQTGQEMWKFKTEGSPGSFPAIDKGEIFITSAKGAGGSAMGGYLYALDRQTGQEKWRFDATSFASDPAVTAGLVFVGNSKGQLYALDAETGQEKWQFQTKGWVGIPAIAGDVLYAGSSDGNLYALDLKTGQEKWRFKTTPFHDMGWPVIADGVAYITSTDGYLYAIQ